jgi:hypothetical protein
MAAARADMAVVAREDSAAAAEEEEGEGNREARHSPRRRI